MPVTKDFKTLDEQIEILHSRHLKFKNKKKAAELLSRYNYFDVINGLESRRLQIRLYRRWDEKTFSCLCVMREL